MGSKQKREIARLRHELLASQRREQATANRLGEAKTSIHETSKYANELREKLFQLRTDLPPPIPLTLDQIEKITHKLPNRVSLLELGRGELWEGRLLRVPIPRDAEEMKTDWFTLGFEPLEPTPSRTIDLKITRIVGGSRTWNEVAIGWMLPRGTCIITKQRES